MNKKLSIKYTLSAVLILFSLVTNAQFYKGLREVSDGEYFKKGHSLIYGNFIQRLGFSSGGFPQHIELLNLDTKEIISFRVKPIFRSARKNSFFYFIKPGHYAILHYIWTQGKAYGGEMHKETIYKKPEFSNNTEQDVNNAKKKPEEIRHYTFSISENSLNYLGTWHFDKEQVFFSDDKVKLENAIDYKYSNIDFTTAIINLPK